MDLTTEGRSGSAEALVQSAHAAGDSRPTSSNAKSGKPLRLLTFSSLFPSLARPRHGIFVETRLRHLIRDRSVDARVIAPVPWFPFRAKHFGRYAAFAATPAEERRVDGTVLTTYPRYLMLPKIGMRLQPRSMAASAARVVGAWANAGWSPDVIDAHYFYPDGVSAALVARRFGKPYLITARGTDINVLARMPGIDRLVLHAAQGASAVIAVSEGLRRSLIDLGVAEAKVVTLRNGVDLEVFRLEEPESSRRRLGLPNHRPLLASVGNLVPEKDQALAIRSLIDLPEYHLVIVGDGVLRAELERLSRRLGVRDRISFLAPMPQAELSHLYSSVEALLLTSRREGWPNVVLEALACGTPVVAVDVGAVREMLVDAGVGRVIQSREPAAVAAAVLDIRATRRSRTELREHAALFDWATISARQWQLLLKAHAAAAGTQRSGA